MDAVTANPIYSLVVNNFRLDVVERGKGRPLVFLHPEIGIDSDAAILDLLGRRTRVIAPVHPGFGQSVAPKWMSSVDDLAYFYLDLLDTLDLRDAVLVGVSFGGWIAAEMAVKSTQRLSHVVLANPVGIKVGDRETRDIVDIFAITESQFNELAYFDPRAGTRDYKAMADADVTAAARNREATARYGWSPYLHDPKLKGRLHRVRIPTLVLWGANDRIVGEGYGRAYAAAIPGAQFDPIARAGHFPHLEQPEEFARRVFAFIGETS
jgi:pimeloyl-ACP methyl ester carboxylesterase